MRRKLAFSQIRSVRIKTQMSEDRRNWLRSGPGGSWHNPRRTHRNRPLSKAERIRRQLRYNAVLVQPSSNLD